MNKYLVRNFKWIENLGKVPAKVYRLEHYHSKLIMNGSINNLTSGN